MADKDVLKSQADLSKSVNDLKQETLAKETLNVAASNVVVNPVESVGAKPRTWNKWPNWKDGPSGKGSVILEMKGQMTKDILQHLANVQATVIQSDEANLSYSISVPQEKLEQTKNFLTNQNVTFKG